MYLLFDIGGTNTRIAFSGGADSFDNPVIIPTKSDFDEALVSMVETSRALVKDAKVGGIIAGITGRLDKTRTYIYKSSSLPGWVDKQLPTSFADAFNAPVYFLNDADLVGLGEVHYGAGKGVDAVMYITISTGVGGGLINQGKIVESSHSPEIGYQYIYGFGKKSAYGNKYDALQRFVSGKALHERYGQDPAEIADSGIWDETAQLIAFGLHNSMMHWSPDMIVLGGSVMKSVKLNQISKHLSKTLQVYEQLPELRLAELGDIGGLYGALAYSKQL